MGRLEDQIAIVTGAGSGIGRVACERFAAEGARVVAVDLDADTAAHTAEAVGGVAVVGDVADPELWARVVATTDELGGIDLAYLNAGVYGHSGPIDELSDGVYSRTVGANVGGVVLGVRAVVPVMRAAGGGAIVATASVAGLVPFAGNPIYSATKHAVAAFVAASAPSLAGDGITIDAVCPGIVDTPMTEGAAGGLDLAALGIDLIEPAEVVTAALDLATSEGTGRCVVVRAGQPPHPWELPTFADLMAPPGD
ncbi:MAG: SDR family oxidoreductase [Acidimicrobiia bacterium]|nr:SDR family oxidoreductase [Acidimicrobiia bacterium]